MIHLSRSELQERANRVKLLVLDVDGVLTEGDLILVGGHVEAKRFDFHDGLGIFLLKSVGIRIAILSDRQSPALTRRAEEMGVDKIAPVLSRDKEASLEWLLGELEVGADEAAYVGDDLRDVAPMRGVAMPLAVANARPQVKEHSVYVTTASGGHGAVRELAEWLLELRGQKDDAIAPFLQTRVERASQPGGFPG